MELRMRLAGVKRSERTEQGRKEMFRKSLLTMVVVGMGAIAIPAIAQTEVPLRQDVAVQAFGSLVTTTTQNGIDNKATNGGGVLASYPYFFSTHHGVEADCGYSLNTQKYVSTSGVTGVSTNSHEISGAYVFRMPLLKITPFALAGAGALVFDPKNYLGASIQTRASFMRGGAVCGRGLIINVQCESHTP